MQQIIRKIIYIITGLIALHAYSTTYYVKCDGSNMNDGLSWSSPFLTVDHALSSSTSGDSIWVCSGYYHSNEFDFRLMPGMALYGGFQGTEESLEDRPQALLPTVIDRNQKTAIMNYGTIEGISLINGYGMGSSGGIMNYGTLERCSVSKCASSDYHNPGYGAGVYNKSSGKMYRCRIYDNESSAQGTGVFNVGYMENCLVYNNAPQNNNGSLYNAGTVMNCTVYGNTGTGIYNDQATVKNTVSWGNAGKDYDFVGSMITNSCYREAELVNGNINTDPHVLAANVFDLRLEEGSPCIDSGDNQDAPTIDFKGNARPHGAIVDMGAYEFQGIDQNRAPGLVMTEENMVLTIPYSQDTYVFEGTVSDCDGSVQSMKYSINNCPWVSREAAVSFALTVSDLPEGKNYVMIKATDDDGADSEIQLYLIDRGLKPEVTIYVDKEVAEVGESIRLSSYSKTNFVQYSWDINNDGDFDFFTAEPVFSYSSPGIYSVRLVAVDLNDQPIEKIMENMISVAPAGIIALNATFLDSTVVDTMEWATDYQVRIRFMNTGKQIWTTDFYKLGAIGNDDPFTESARYNLANKVRYGEIAAFNLIMRKDTPGVYLTDWQMVQEGVAWFGDSFTKLVTVQRSTCVAENCWTIYY